MGALVRTDHDHLPEPLSQAAQVPRGEGWVASVSEPESKPGAWVLRKSDTILDGKGGRKMLPVVDTQKLEVSGKVAVISMIQLQEKISHACQGFDNF